MDTNLFVFLYKFEKTLRSDPGRFSFFLLLVYKYFDFLRRFSKTFAFDFQNDSFVNYFFYLTKRFYTSPMSEIQGDLIFRRKFKAFQYNVPSVDFFLAFPRDNFFRVFFSFLFLFINVVFFNLFYFFYFVFGRAFFFSTYFSYLFSGYRFFDLSFVLFLRNLFFSFLTDYYNFYRVFYFSYVFGFFVWMNRFFSFLFSSFFFLFLFFLEYFFIFLIFFF